MNPLLGTLLDSGWSQIMPYGDCVAIIKDDDEERSAGGILIPGAHQEYKRRGWVLAVGGGRRLPNGKLVLPPYSPGDYLFADRPFIRPNQHEDEIFKDPTIMLIPIHTEDDMPSVFIRKEDCVGKYARYALPEKHREIVEKFGYKPSDQ